MFKGMFLSSIELTLRGVIPRSDATRNPSSAARIARGQTEERSLAALGMTAWEEVVHERADCMADVTDHRMRDWSAILAARDHSVVAAV